MMAENVDEVQVVDGCSERDRQLRRHCLTAVEATTFALRADMERWETVMEDQVACIRNLHEERQLVMQRYMSAMVDKAKESSSNISRSDKIVEVSFFVVQFLHRLLDILR